MIGVRGFVKPRALGFARLVGSTVLHIMRSPMNPRIRISKIWSDVFALELTIEVSDGKSLFSNNAYVSIDWPKSVIGELRIFRKGIHGGIYDLNAGEFGLEYANGAFLARLHFRKPETLFVSTSQQSEFVEFKGNQIASEAKLFLKTEPALLDTFIEELAAMDRGERLDATLECR